MGDNIHIKYKILQEVFELLSSAKIWQTLGFEHNL
jgi:hypothetical protein